MDLAISRVVEIAPIPTKIRPARNFLNEPSFYVHSGQGYSVRLFLKFNRVETLVDLGPIQFEFLPQQTGIKYGAIRTAVKAVAAVAASRRPS
jgi:hypothetical protein